MSRGEECELFMSQLQETNQTLGFFCDFEKISANVEDVKLSLCMLNSLIGATDLRKAVETIWNRDKTAFSVMDILIATRNRDKKKYVNAIGESRRVSSLFTSIDGVMEFLEDTGLAELFQSKKTTILLTMCLAWRQALIPMLERTGVATSWKRPSRGCLTK